MARILFGLDEISDLKDGLPMKPICLLAAMLSLASLAACGGGSAGNGDTHPGGTPQGNVPVTSTVSGTITDKSGAPIAGATVSVFHHNDNTTVTTTTDANGRYAVAGLVTARNADYEIYAIAPGLALYPQITDAAASVSKFDFMGLYRTVIQFPTLPARDVAGANFVASRAGDALVSLARTGQSVSYAAGDDGAVDKGTAWPGTRFTDNLDGSVSDHLTGLVWLKDAGCLGPGDWTSALAAVNVLASGACGLADGSTPGQWRMPNVNELESLVDVSQANPAVPAASPFVNIDVATAYWSSTTYMASTSNAMAIRFSDGRWINGVDAGDGLFNNAKTSAANATWAVRSGAPGLVSLLATGVYSGQGGASFGAGDDASLQIGVPLNSQRFIDRGDGTLADTETGLVWLKRADCIAQSWSAALASVNALASGQCGLTDGSSAGQWRMPNRREMLSIADRAPTFAEAAYLDGQYQASSVVTGPAVFTNFIVSDYYWTSTTDAADATQAWSVYSCDFGAYDMAKTATRYSLAVR